MGLRRGQFTAALERGDPYLEDLKFWYRDNAPRLGIETRAFCENEPLKGLAVVVDKESADPGDVVVVPVDGNHVTICKPGSKDKPNYKQFAGPVRSAVEQCPAFRETHMAALDVGKRFKKLTELHPDERLPATKRVVHPIEVKLGRREGVEFERSTVGPGPFNVAKWQEGKAQSSDYDLDRVILYVWYEYREMSAGKSTTFVTQEYEKLKKDPNRLSLIPLHYAARMLLKHKDKGTVDLKENDKRELQQVLDFVEEQAVKFQMDGGFETRNKLRALLGLSPMRSKWAPLN